MRLIVTLCAATMALVACDPAELDPDPEVRAEARGARKCVTAVREQTSDGTAVLNTVLPIVEINQFIVDVPGDNSRWLCQTNDAGTPQELLKLSSAI